MSEGSDTMSILVGKQFWRRNLPPGAQAIRDRFDLTVPEQLNVRRAIRALQLRLGSPAKFAAALGMTMDAMYRARAPSRKPSPRLAYLIAKVAKVPLDDVLSGAWPDTRHCPACGQVVT